jgi:phospholipid/cholesterol/gamma-HCH transport system substrate-binding protein
MRGNLRRVLVWVAFFTMLSGVGMGLLVAVFGQLRFDTRNPYKAEFVNVSGLEGGNFVRVAGVEVGKVTSVTLRGDGLVDVGFAVDQNIHLTKRVRAAVRYENLVGGRFLALEDGPGSVEPLRPGMVIPATRTSPALDIDALIGGFRPLFRALDPEQVNALSSQLLAVFQGQGGTISSVLAQTATLTSTLAGHGRLIGEVIGNLQTVLATFAARDGQFSASIDNLAQLMHGLAQRKTDITNGLAYIDAGSRSIADLLAHARPPLLETVNQTGRVAGQIMADRDYLDNLIKTLPDAYQIMNRQGIYGDFFNFYICDVALKVNGKGGQPVYIKVVGQDTGRCTPK